MQFLKSLLRGLASATIKFGLVSLAIVSVIVMVFGTPILLKKALHDSKVYDNVVDNVIQTTTNQPQDPSSTTLISAPQVKQAAKTAFNPSFIQSSTEQVIDSVYKWLEGKSVKPDFRLDLSAPKLRFATAAADNAAARAQQLPACTLQQSRELVARGEDTIDPFNLPCLPPNIDASAIRNKVISDLANNEDFVKTPVLTADSLQKDSQGKTIFDNLAQAPRIFHWLMIAPWIICGLTVLSAIFLVILYDEKRRGVRAVAMILLGSGIFLLVATVVFGYALRQANQPNGYLARLVNVTGAESNLLAFFNSINSIFSTRLLLFGAAYTGLGAVVLLILRLTRPKQAEELKPVSDLKETESVSQPANTSPDPVPETQLKDDQ